jgi:hypothetical protein
MSPATLLFGIFLGMAIATPLTYIWTWRKCTKDSVTAFKLRQIPLQTHEGCVRKKFYVTLLERLEYNGIPLPWWTTKIPVGEKLDEASLTALAEAASVIVKIPDLKGLGIEIISRILPKAPENASTTLQ